MTTFYVTKDYEKSEHAGAIGTFQVVSLRRLIDDKEIPVTDKIDVGIHFRDDNHLKTYISEMFGIGVDEVELFEK